MNKPQCVNSSDAYLWRRIAQLLDSAYKLLVSLAALKRCAFTVLDDEVANSADTAQGRQGDFDAI